jgi:hypothetical protein
MKDEVIKFYWERGKIPLGTQNVNGKIILTLWHQMMHMLRHRVEG